MKIGETKIFYPIFCLDCQLNFISIKKARYCPFCKGMRTIDYEGNIYKNVKEKELIKF